MAENDGAIKKSNMYDRTVTWNPFKGCEFDCTYCVPSFQKQAKRQKHRCRNCYEYTPHYHPERLPKIPNAPIVFVCGNGDIAFCSVDFLKRIIQAIKDRGRPDTTYYLQSKDPNCFKPILANLPPNVVLVITLETNRDEGYGNISKAPNPMERYMTFMGIDWPRKIVTMEPMLDFDMDYYIQMIVDLNPECVWIGFNTRKMENWGPEPSLEKVKELMDRLRASGIVIKGKTLRGIEMMERRENG